MQTTAWPRKGTTGWKAACRCWPASLRGAGGGVRGPVGCVGGCGRWAAGGGERWQEDRCSSAARPLLLPVRHPPPGSHEELVLVTSSAHL